MTSLPPSLPRVSFTVCTSFTGALPHTQEAFDAS